VSKLDELRELRNLLQIKIIDQSNNMSDSPNIYIANHNNMRDIFYLAAAIEHEIISLISARLIYKKEPSDRLKLVNKYLNAFPIEAHGGCNISNLCLHYSSHFLKEGLDIAIFPEGAYVEENVIHRGRTGVTRILYDYLDATDNKRINLIPVAIDNISNNLDIDNFYPSSNEQITITFLPPIDYEEDYENFKNARLERKNDYLHRPVDKSMQAIAKTLGREYSNEYIELYKKGNVIFQDGNTIDTTLVISDKKYQEIYNNELNKRFSSLVKKLKR